MKLKNLVILVGIIIVLFVVALANLIKINSQCDSNPFIYGAQNLEKQGLDAQCQCSLTNAVGKNSIIYFNSDGVSIEDDMTLGGQNLNTTEVFVNNGNN